MATISIQANAVRPSVYRRPNDNALGREHYHGKTQYIPAGLNGIMTVENLFTICKKKL